MSVLTKRWAIGLAFVCLAAISFIVNRRRVETPAGTSSPPDRLSSDDAADGGPFGYGQEPQSGDGGGELGPKPTDFYSTPNWGELERPADIPYYRAMHEIRNQILQIEHRQRQGLLEVVESTGAAAAFRTALQWTEGGDLSLEDRVRILTGIRALPGLAILSGDANLLLEARAKLVETLADRSRPAAARMEALSALFGTRPFSDRRVPENLMPAGFEKNAFVNVLRPGIEHAPRPLPEGEALLMLPGVFEKALPDSATVELLQELALAPLREENRDLTIAALTALACGVESAGLTSLDARLDYLTMLAVSDDGSAAAHNYAWWAAQAILRSAPPGSSAWLRIEEASIQHPNPWIRAALVEVTMSRLSHQEDHRKLAISYAGAPFVRESGQWDPEGATTLGLALVRQIRSMRWREKFADRSEFENHLLLLNETQLLFEDIVDSVLALPDQDESRGAFGSWERWAESMPPDMHPESTMLLVRIGDDPTEIPVPGTYLRPLLISILERHGELPRARRLLESIYAQDAEGESVKLSED